MNAECLWNVQICEFLLFNGENRKNNYRIMQKKNQIFGQTCMEFDGCHGKVKNDRETIYMSKCPQRMNK